MVQLSEPTQVVLLHQDLAMEDSIIQRVLPLIHQVIYTWWIISTIVSKNLTPAVLSNGGWVIMVQLSELIPVVPDNLVLEMGNLIIHMLL